MKHNTKNTQNENAVSPVIGVLLMVSVTVILAAIIAAFVFGMATQVHSPKILAATVQQPNANTMYITYYGGQDATTFTGANVSVTPATGSATFTVQAPGTASLGWLSPSVGSTQTVTGTFNGEDHVVVTGWFSDGTKQIILDAIV